MKPTDILTKELFKAWLVENKSKRIFRVNKNSFQYCSCPIAKFLQAKGFTNVKVYGECVIWRDVPYQTMGWVKDFVKAFDKSVNFNGHSWGKKSVIGSKILKLLEEI